MLGYKVLTPDNFSHSHRQLVPTMPLTKKEEQICKVNVKLQFLLGELFRHVSHLFSVP